MILENILSLLENNDEFCSKKFDLMMQIGDMNKNFDNLEINRDIE